MADEKFTPPPLNSYQGMSKKYKAEREAASKEPPVEEPGVLERTWNAMGGQGLDDLTRSIVDPAAKERTVKRLGGMWEGIKNEPGRVVSEVQQAGRNFMGGNYSDALEHVGRAVPFLGPANAQILNDISTDQYPEMIGHVGQTYGPFALKYAGAPLRAAGEAKNVIRDAAVGGYRGGAERVPLGKPFGIDFSETQVPASLKWGLALGLPSEGLGLARGNLTSGIPAGLLGASVPVVRGAFKNVKAGRALRSGATAATEPLATVDEIAESLGGKKYRNLTPEEQASVDKIQGMVKPRNITQERPSAPLPPASPNASKFSPYEMVREHIKTQRAERLKPKAPVERNPAWKEKVSAPEPKVQPKVEPIQPDVSQMERMPPDIREAQGLAMQEQLRQAMERVQAQAPPPSPYFSPDELHGAIVDLVRRRKGEL